MLPYNAVLVLDEWEAVDDPLGARDKIRQRLVDRFGIPDIRMPDDVEDVWIPSSTLVFLLKRQGIIIAMQSLVHWAKDGWISRRLLPRTKSRGGLINHYNPYEVHVEYYNKRKGRPERKIYWDVNRLVKEWQDGI